MGGFSCSCWSTTELFRTNSLKSGLINEDPEEEEIDDVDQEFEEVKEMVGQDEYTTQQEAKKE